MERSLWKPTLLSQHGTSGSYWSLMNVATPLTKYCKILERRVVNTLIKLISTYSL